MTDNAADRCHLCGHKFHGLPCRMTSCQCQTAWVEPDDEGNAA